MFKMKAKNDFSFRENSHVSKIWKTTFPEGFFFLFACHGHVALLIFLKTIFVEM